MTDVTPPAGDGVVLRECPFCGASAVVYFNSLPAYARVTCSNQKCAAKPSVVDRSRKLATARWNRRTASQEPALQNVARCAAAVVRNVRAVAYRDASGLRLGEAVPAFAGLEAALASGTGAP